MKELKMKTLNTTPFIKSISCFLLFALMMSPVYAQDNIIDEIVATIGADAIQKFDIEERFYRMQAEGFDFEGDLKCHILEQMMVEKLLITQAKLDSIEVDESMVIAQVDQQVNFLMSQIGSREKMEEYFNKKTIDLKEELRRVYFEQSLTQQMQGKITENVSATPAEIRRFYEKMKEDEIPEIPMQFEIQKIVIAPRVEQEEIDRIKGKLREYQKQVNEGQDFAIFAILHSEDPGSAKRGGEIGFKGRGELVPEYANVAFNLRDKNKVSRVVESEYGFHIIQLIDRRGNKVNTRHILLKPKISEKSKQDAMEVLDSIKNIITVEEKMTFEQCALYFSTDEDTRSNGGLMVNAMTGASKFQISDQTLNPQIAKQAEFMKIGDISKPFIYKDKTGKDVTAIIKLRSKIDAHKANLKDDFQFIKEMVLQQKQQEMLKTWILERQKDTYISIDEKWVNCEFEYPGWIKK